MLQRYDFQKPEVVWKRVDTLRVEFEPTNNNTDKHNTRFVVNARWRVAREERDAPRTSPPFLAWTPPN